MRRKECHKLNSNQYYRQYTFFLAVSPTKLVCIVVAAAFILKYPN